MENNNNKIAIQYYENELIEYDKDIVELTERLSELKELRMQRENIIKKLEKRL